MIRSKAKTFAVIASLIGGALPFAAMAQVTGKENVPGGVENRPAMPAPGAPAAIPSPAPAAPSMSRVPAPVMASPPTVGASGAASTVGSQPPAAKVVPPPKGSAKKSKRAYGAGRPKLDAMKPGETAPKSTLPPGIGGAGDERRPGGVERAPAQPQ